jgi:hypothetical protein
MMALTRLTTPMYEYWVVLLERFRSEEGLQSFASRYT